MIQFLVATKLIQCNIHFRQADLILFFRLPQLQNYAYKIDNHPDLINLNNSGLNEFWSTMISLNIGHTAIIK